MKSMFRQAIKEYGQYDPSDHIVTRWLLPDGSFLGVPDYDDHRIVGEFCNKTWLEFIRERAVSLHYSGDYLWLRVNEDLTWEQRAAFRTLHDDETFSVSVLLVHVYDGLRHVESFELDEPGMVKLWLTDKIAYDIEVGYAEDY